MGSMLNGVTRGKVKKPHLVLIYGPDGVGKSSFGAQAPGSIFLGSEDGTNNIDVARLPAVKKWEDVFTAVGELISDEHKFQTLVVDSLDWLEPILHQEICIRHNAKSIELAAGGYGKGYVEAVSEWNRLCKSLIQLRERRQMNIVIIAHSEVIKFNDPSTNSEYDRYQLKLHKKSAALFREFVDTVLFANYETFAKKDGSKVRAYGDGARVLFTERRPGFDAKNRSGLPFTLSLSLDGAWKEYEDAVNNGKVDDPKVLIEAIQNMLTEVQDEALKKTVQETVEKFIADPVKLEAIRNKLAVRLGQ